MCLPYSEGNRKLVISHPISSKRVGTMKRFCEFCMKAKIVAVELTALLGFLGILGLVLYLEWHHLLAWAAIR